MLQKLKTTGSAGRNRAKRDTQKMEHVAGGGPFSFTSMPCANVMHSLPEGTLGNGAGVYAVTADSLPGEKRKEKDEEKGPLFQ